MSSMECPLCGDSRTRVFLGASEDSLEGRSYFECALCRLVFLSPDLRLSGEEEKKRYDLHCNSPEDEGYLRFLSRLTEPLTRILPPGSEGWTTAADPDLPSAFCSPGADSKPRIMIPTTTPIRPCFKKNMISSRARKRPNIFIFPGGSLRAWRAFFGAAAAWR